MRKISTLFILSLLCLVANTSFGQAKKNAIKFNIFGILGSQYQLGYERALTENLSAQLSAGYITYNSSQSWGSNSYKSKTNGFIFIPEVRFYFSEGLKGAYLAGFFRYRQVNTDLTDTSDPMSVDVSRKEKVSSIGGGLTLGYQALISDALVIDIFIGPQTKTRSSSVKYKYDGVTDADFNKFLDFKVKDKSGVGIRFGVNIGIAF